MEVDPAETRNAEQPRGNYLTVGDDNDDVGAGFTEEMLGIRSADSFGLENAQVFGDSRLFYCGAGNRLAAPARTIGLGNHSGDFEVGLIEKVFEARNRKGGRATEKQAKPGFAHRFR